MSASAFTPSTTTVTNNVPVNVPVVEASQLITATVTNGGTISGQRVNISRVGDKLFFEGSINFSAAGSAANFQLNMPTGLTIDTSKLDSATGAYGNHIGTAGWWDTGIGSKQLMPWVDTSTRISFAIAGSAVNLKGNDLAIGDSITFALFLPIAEWAGSGTTTLATRAVEEYAYNTNTSNTSNTSAFANGPDGVLFPQITTFGVSVNKRVRFQTSILPTDAIILEYQQAGSGSWRTMSQRLPIIQQGANGYGVDIVNVSGSTTDIDIGFREGGAVTNGATYGANGEAWNAYYLAGWKWRVRKVSSGAQVGYPVSARNIVGDTSGSVVPTGMLGERVTSGVLSSTTVINTTNTDLTSISIGAGVWLVSTRATLSYTSGTGLNDRGNVACWITDGTTVYGQITPAYAKTMVSGNQNASVGNASFSSIVNTSTPKTLTFRAVRSDIQNTSGATAQTESANNGLELFAIRIA